MQYLNGLMKIKCRQIEIKLNIDSKLNFDKNIKIISGNVQKKINALKRVTLLKNIEKRKLIINAFFNSNSVTVLRCSIFVLLIIKPIVGRKSVYTEPAMRDNHLMNSY